MEIFPSITAQFDASEPNGVIVAQGGVARGYSLFLQDGRLVFVVRSASEPVSISSPEVVKGPQTVVAKLDRDGAMTLDVNGVVVARAKASGPIPTMPVDGLEVGLDGAGLVGPYSENNAFKGEIQSVVIELQ